MYSRKTLDIFYLVHVAVRQRLLQYPHAGVANLRPEEDQVLELSKSLEVLHTGVGDLRSVEVQTPDLGQFSDMFQAIIVQLCLGGPGSRVEAVP